MKHRVVDVGLPLHVIEVVDPDDVPRPNGPTGQEHSTESGPGVRLEPECFVLLHGYAASSFTWRYWAPALARRGRVLLVDMKGFGSAPKPDDGLYGPVDLSRLVISLFDRLQLDRVTLVGHSLGGGVALLTALELYEREPSRVARLVLVASPAYRQPLPPFVALAHRPRLSTFFFRLFGARRVVRHTLKSIVFASDEVSDQQVEAYASPLRSRAGLAAALSAGRTIVPDSVDEIARRIPGLDVPTLLIWGDRDRVIPLWVGQRLEVELPRARLVVLDRCGHVPPEERPQESLSALEALLDGER